MVAARPGPQARGRRIGCRRVAAGTGRKAVLAPDDRVVITLLALRFSLSGPVLARMSQVTTTTINNVIRQNPGIRKAGYSLESFQVSTAALKGWSLPIAPSIRQPRSPRASTSARQLSGASGASMRTTAQPSGSVSPGPLV